MFKNFEKTYLSVFPEFRSEFAVCVNMDEYLAQPKVIRHGVSLFLDPPLTQKYLKSLHIREEAAYSFGGYLEDRRNLWNGSYMDPEKSVHLGIDINAPAGTSVAVVHPSRVVKIVHDPDQEGGWGSVIVFKLEKNIGDISHFLYAHLSKNDIRVQIGDLVDSQKIVATLGRPEENGGWYEHLHVQAMTPEAWAMLKDRDDMGAFDGYDSMPEKGQEHHLSPDPLLLLLG